MKALAVYLSISFSLPLLAANDSTKVHNWEIKPVFGKGFILVHRVTIGHLVKAYTTNYEINLCRSTTGAKRWQVENNRPDIGITLQALDFGNHEQLGFALTAAPYVEIPLNEKEKMSRVIMRVCWGATYITKSFDIVSNHKNIAIGSHLNSFVQFRWLWQLKINERLRFEPGISFTHASNGKSKNPNLGLNVMGLNAGLHYRISSAARVVAERPDTTSKKKPRYQVALAAAYGFNQRGINTPLLNSYMFSASVLRNKRNTHSFSAGFDMMYDQNYLIDYKERLGYEASGFQALRIATRLGYAYNIGAISLPIEIGVYAWQRINPDAKLVSRLGVRYFHKSGLSVNFGLRTHYAVAYTFEYGLGYCFGLKK